MTNNKSKIAPSLHIIYTLCIACVIITISSTILIKTSIKTILFTFPNNATTTNENINIIKFMYSNEHWVLVHYISMFYISTLAPSMLTAVAIMYMWESFEVIASITTHIAYYNSGSTYPTFSVWISESAGDSLIGDIMVGFMGILFAIWLSHMKHSKFRMIVLNEFNHSCQLCAKHFMFKCFFKRYRILFTYLLFYALGFWIEVIGGITIITGFNNEIIPIGFFMYPFIKILWISIYWKYLNTSFNGKYNNTIARTELYVNIHFIIAYVSCVSLKVPSFPCILIGAPLSILLIIIMI